MILTIMKQTTSYHLDEKDFEVASIYADLYSKMIIQYLNQEKRAVAALKDLASEFINHGLYRSAVSFFQLVVDHYGISSFNDKDLCKLGDVYEKVHKESDALKCYERIINHYKYSPFRKKACKKLSSLYSNCGNRYKSSFFKKKSKATVKVQEKIS